MYKVVTVERFCKNVGAYYLYLFINFYFVLIVFILFSVLFRIRNVKKESTYVPTSLVEIRSISQQPPLGKKKNPLASILYY
jgi:hypothetical protein